MFCHYMNFFIGMLLRDEDCVIFCDLIYISKLSFCDVVIIYDAS